MNTMRQLLMSATETVAAREHVRVVRCVEEAGGRAGDVHVAVAPQDRADPGNEITWIVVLLLLVADHRGAARREERVVVEPERHAPRDLPRS